MQVTLLMMAAQVISAFEVPKVQYDPVRKCFFKPTASLELLGIAQVRPETTQLVLGDEVETQQKCAARPSHVLLSIPAAAMEA